MSFQTGYARVLGLGSAREGTHHWWQQRLTSIALLILTLPFVIPFARALGSSHDEVLQIYGNSGHALVAILFIGVGFLHLRQGLQVVIEDYVHNRLMAMTLTILNILGCWGFGILGIYAIGRIALLASVT
ncbi:MAG: succinate dehydrogenase, hydrophobic membrane anchor protein [Rhodobacteraceae bacterium]|nr:succinate dehydrogenase, hydrophobic membrane anchor protein [Paracoccaceae bacterium]